MLFYPTFRDFPMDKQFYGMSAYAGMHKRFPAERFMQQYPKKMKAPGIAFLCGCFGWNWALVKLFCNQFADREHIIEFHISNGAGRRSGKLGPGAYLKGVSVSAFNNIWEPVNAAEIPEARIDAEKKLSNLINKLGIGLAGCMNSNTRILICPELEDNMLDSSFGEFCRAVKHIWRQGKYTGTIDMVTVRSPCTSGTGTKTVRHKEVHGVTTPPHNSIGNLDGVSVYAGDKEGYFKRITLESAKAYLQDSEGYMTLLWSATQQGVGNASGWSSGWPPHKLRIFTVTDEAILQFRRLLNDY